MARRLVPGRRDGAFPGRLAQRQGFVAHEGARHALLRRGLPMAELANRMPGKSAPVASWVNRLAIRRVDVRAWSGVRRLILALSILYLAKQVIFVFAFPAFTGHDEVAHYSYLRTVATEGRVPVLLEDRLPPELYKYCKFTLGWICFQNTQQYLDNPPYQWPYSYRGQNVVYQEGYQYAANHPPLYYMLMAPVYWLSDGASPETQIYLLRLAVIPFGLVTVLLAFLMARVLFPGDAFLAVTVPAFVAFQTQISYEAAMVNNDIVAIALYSWILYLLVRGLRDRFPGRICVLIGFVLGLALLAKGTSLTAAPIIGGTVILGVGWRSWRTWLKRGVQIVVPAAILVSPWYAFLYRTYGNLSGLPQVQEIQWWDNPSASFFGLLFDRGFALERFRETWGYFGWKKIFFDDAMYWAIGIPLLIALGGLVQYLVVANPIKPLNDNDDRVERPKPWQYGAIWVLLGTSVVAYLAVVQFGVDFSLTQARYYFPVVNAAALLLMLGLRTLLPKRLHRIGQGAVVGALVVLTVVILSQYVLPYYAGWEIGGGV